MRFDVFSVKVRKIGQVDGVISKCDFRRLHEKLQ